MKINVVINRDARELECAPHESLMTVLRREGYPEPYEALKDLTRTHTLIDQGAITEFIQSLDVDDEVKSELLGITPENYIGVCEF